MHGGYLSLGGDSNSYQLDLFEKLLPQIVYSLQSMDLFLWMEKDLLVRRGIIRASSAHVRSATWSPDQRVGVVHNC